MNGVYLEIGISIATKEGFQINAQSMVLSSNQMPTLRIWAKQRTVLEASIGIPLLVVVNLLGILLGITKHFS